jgi:cell division protein FtsW
MSTFTRTDTSLLGRWWWTVDRVSIGVIILIAAIGLVLTLAASPAVAARLHLDPFYFARRQALYVPMALVVLFLTSLLSPQGVRRLAIVVFLVALAMTIATLFAGLEVKGARRWLWFAGVSVQPSEFLKPAFVVLSAWMIVRAKLNDDRTAYPISVALFLLVAGVLSQQPDVGTTLLLAGAWCMQMFVVGCPLFVIGLMMMLGVAGGVVSYFAFEHVRLRVDHFLDPSVGDGYQVARALDAFRSGGLFGRGPGEGRVKEVLPDAHSDFIFAVAGEEFGLLLCVILVVLFAVMVLQGFSRALKDNDLFVVIAASGLLALFGAQALMNMASTLHLIPPKGITLPFVSYGGSATIALAWTIGLVLALTRERPGGAGAP